MAAVTTRHYSWAEFMSNVTPSDVPHNGSPCWIWTATRDRDGYGTLPSRARETAGDSIRAHRFSYVIVMRKRIDPGMVLDHSCRTRSCVNPLHLSQKTNAQNVLENSEGFAAKNVRKTHCPQGHPYDEANTKINYKGGRICRICEKEHQRAHQARRRARRDAGLP